MEHGYTANSLIRYIYGETFLTKRLEIENAISNDQELAKKYEELKSGFHFLPKVLFYPGKAVIDNIIRYSKKTSFNASC